MRKTEGDGLGPHFRWRLQFVLDRVQPRYSAPRYQRASRMRSRRWMPMTMTVGVTSVAVLTLLATQGTDRPLDLERRIMIAIQPNAEPSPTPENSPAQPPPQAAPPAPANRQSPHPSQPASSENRSRESEASPRPRTTPSPTPGGEHPPTPSPSPSPSPSGEH